MGRKNDSPEEVEQIISTMTKYGEIKNNHSNRTSAPDSAALTDPDPQVSQ
ncbi:MAG: hypothetical protein WBZ36_30245 [Candidatus Nitrosopolaris sp.]